MTSGRDRLGGVPPRLVATLAFGTTLNPLNSSMIAVALVSLQGEFQVSIADVTWLVSGFYVAAAVGQPLMGRLIDQFGPRRLFLFGLALVLATSAVMPFAPGLWWLVALRVVQAFGTSTAYPAAMTLIRSAAPAGGTPAGALGAISMANSSCAALGPVLGGFLVALAGWPAVFVVNVPLTVIGLILAWRVLPRTRPEPAQRHQPIDLLGILLFTATLISLLIFILSFAAGPRWWLLPVIIAAGAGLVLWERRVAAPFLDIRGLIANRPLTSVLAQQGAINLTFYSMFFSLPLWLESVRGFGSDAAGLMILPVAGLGIATVPLAARMIRRVGSRPALLLGSCVLLGATLLIQLLGDASPIALIILLTLAFGIPNGFNNLGLQTSLYDAAPPDRTASAAGLFQTFRYLGAILATAMIGLIFERDLSSSGLHHLGWLMTGGAVVVLLLALLIRRPVRESER
ncbi:MFS transporter [Microlunatus speluncae]|uniref:MFS transporter n=1 Tax=Microlunatus speluncae TaxID=2594267 RepID=UPI001266309D|nr:MFS transporter [Microlunatus speluncae]